MLSLGRSSIIFIAAAVLLALQPVTGIAATYSIAMQTDKQSYSASDTLIVNGSITPPPGPGTSILLKVLNPNGVIVYITPSGVNGTTGFFSRTVVLGGTPSWIDGKYVINGTWAPSLTGLTYLATVGFNYTIIPSAIPEFPSLPVVSLTLACVLGLLAVAQLRFGKRILVKSVGHSDKASSAPVNRQS